MISIRKNLPRLIMIMLSIATIVQLSVLYCQADTLQYTDEKGTVWNYTEETLTGTDGDYKVVVIQGCDTVPSSGELDIPEEIDGIPVRMIGNQAFIDRTDIKSVIFPDGVTIIRTQAFQNCTNLSEIKLGSGLEHIYNNAFQGCAMTELEIPPAVNYIEPYAFMYCQNLAAFNVDADNQHFCDVDGVMFSKSCDKLFFYPIARKASSYTVPDGVSTISAYAFAGSVIETVTIPASVSVIESGAFYGDEQLSTVNMSESGTIETLAGYVFFRCKSLKTINIPGSVRVINEYCFANCTSLETITIPESVESIGYSAFSSCTSLSRVALPDSLSELGERAFSDTAVDQSFHIPAGLETIPSRAFSNCQKLKHIVIPDTVKSISRFAFQSCYYLSDVYIASPDTEIKDLAFSSCGPMDYNMNIRLFSICAPADSAVAAYAKERGYDVYVCDLKEYDKIMAVDKRIYGQGSSQDEDPDEGGNSGGNGDGEGESGGNGSGGGNEQDPSGDKPGDSSGGSTGSSTGGSESGNSKNKDTSEAAPSGSKTKDATAKKSTKKPGKPKLTAKNKKTRSVKLTWKKTANADGYMIYVKGPGDKKFKKRVTRSAKVKSVTHRGLIKGKTYRYKIAAYKIIKGKKVRGPFSKVIKVKIKK